MTDAEKRLREVALVALAALATIPENLRNERWHHDTFPQFSKVRVETPDGTEYAGLDIARPALGQTAPELMAHIAASDPHVVLALLDRIDALEADSAAMVAELEARDADAVRGLALASAGPATLRDGRAAFGLTFTGARDAMLRMADAMVTFFKGEGGVNYVETQVHHPEDGDFILSVQRAAGKTPHELRREAEGQRDTLTTAAQRAAAELRHALRFRRPDGSVDVNLVSRAVVLLEEATTPGRPEKTP